MSLVFEIRVKAPKGADGSRVSAEIDVVQKLRVNVVLVDQLGGIHVSFVLKHLEIAAAVVLNRFGEGLDQSLFGKGHCLRACVADLLTIYLVRFVCQITFVTDPVFVGTNQHVAVLGLTRLTP